MRKETGYDPDYDFLYDPQQAPSYGWCEVCGMEVYAKGEPFCYDCRERYTEWAVRRLLENARVL